MINTYINLPVTQPYYGAQMSRYLITLDSEVHANNAAAQTAITSAALFACTSESSVIK